MDKEYYYQAETDLIGGGVDGDMETTPIPAGTKLKLTYFSEYSLELEMLDGSGKIVSLGREWVCADVSSPNYYDNYFSLPKGLIRLNPDPVGTIYSPDNTSFTE